MQTGDGENVIDAGVAEFVGNQAVGMFAQRNGRRYRRVFIHVIGHGNGILHAVAQAERERAVESGVWLGRGLLDYTHDFIAKVEGEFDKSIALAGLAGTLRNNDLDGGGAFRVTRDLQANLSADVVAFQVVGLVKTRLVGGMRRGNQLAGQGDVISIGIGGREDLVARCGRVHRDADVLSGNFEIRAIGLILDVLGLHRQNGLERIDPRVGVDAPQNAHRHHHAPRAREEAHRVLRLQNPEMNGSRGRVQRFYPFNGCERLLNEDFRVGRRSRRNGDFAAVLLQIILAECPAAILVQDGQIVFIANGLEGFQLPDHAQADIFRDGGLSLELEKGGGGHGPSFFPCLPLGRVSPRAQQRVRRLNEGNVAGVSEHHARQQQQHPKRDLSAIGGRSAVQTEFGVGGGAGTLGHQYKCADGAGRQRKRCRPEPAEGIGACGVPHGEPDTGNKKVAKGDEFVACHGGPRGLGLRSSARGRWNGIGFYGRGGLIGGHAGQDNVRIVFAIGLPNGIFLRGAVGNGQKSLTVVRIERRNCNAEEYGKGQHSGNFRGTLFHDLSPLN